MKKIVAIGLMLSLLLSACSEKGVSEVKPNVVLEQFEQEQSFVVYLGLSYCSACKIFRSVIESSMKTEDFDVLYLEYDALMENEVDASDLERLIADYLQQNVEFSYTFPILYVVEAGEIIDQFSLIDTDTEIEFIARLKTDGVLVSE